MSEVFRGARYVIRSSYLNSLSLCIHGCIDGSVTIQYLMTTPPLALETLCSVEEMSEVLFKLFLHCLSLVISLLIFFKPPAWFSKEILR